MAAKRKKANVLRAVVTWAALIAGFAVFSVFKDQIGIPPNVWLLAAVILVYVHYRLERLEERIGLADLPKHDGLIAEVHEPAIDVVHDRPDAPKDGWGVTDESTLFFAHFETFGDVFNDYLERRPWRVQEKGDNDVSTIGDWGPHYGRRYDIFLGSRMIGRMSLSDGYKYALENPQVHADVEVWDARAIPAGELTGFLDGLAAHIAGGNQEEIDRSHNTVRSAMIDAMWLVGPDVLVRPETLEVDLEGSALWFLQKAGLVERPRSEIDDLLDNLRSSFGAKEER
jgi:hypothetical protein